jgi:hypothetical protein
MTHNILYLPVDEEEPDRFHQQVQKYQPGQSFKKWQ